jgi:hypothetical protein
VIRSRPWLAAALLLVALPAIAFGPMTGQRLHGADHDLLRVAEHATFIAEYGHVHGGVWRPLALLSLRTDLGWAGSDSATPFLLVNLGLHILNGLLSLLALRLLGVTPVAAAGIACALALHPLQVETVTSLAGRGELLAALCLLAGLLLHLARPRRSTLVELGVLACTLVGVAASPIGLLLPFTIVLLDLGVRGISPARSVLLANLPIAIAALLGAVLLVSVQTRDPNAFAASISLLDRIHQIGAAALFSLRDLLLPQQLSAFHPAPPRLPMATVWAALGGLVGLVAVAARNRPRALSGFLFLMVALGTASLRGAVSVQYRADSWLYLTPIALAWLLAGTVGRSGRVTALAAAAVLTSWSILSHEQIGYRRDDATMVRRALDVDPDNWWARTVSAELALNRSDEATATEDALRAVTIQPRSAWAVVALADAHRQSGDEEAALMLYRLSTRSGWADPEAGQKVGLTLLEVGHAAAAVELLERAGSDAGLALAYARSGEVDAATARVAAALRAPGTSPEERVTLAWLLATAPEAELRDPGRARALVDGLEPSPRRLDVEAAAAAGLGEFASAVRLAQQAARIAEINGRPGYASRIRDRALVYLQGQAWYESR